jgi:hypothetical protein
MDMNEHLDYTLFRLKAGSSKCLQPGNWCYLDSKGGLHKLKNEGYYFGWRTNMWVHSYWCSKSLVWGAGEIAQTKKDLIRRIENSVSHYSPWLRGFGKEGF